MSILKFIEKVCVQTAVYWAPLDSDGYGGMIYADPREIKVRWDDVTEVIKADNGEEITSRARLLVTEKLEYKGCVWLGKLNELSIDKKNDPRMILDAYEIITTHKTPLFRSTDKFVHDVYL